MRWIDDLNWDVTSLDVRPVQRQVAHRLKTFSLRPGRDRTGRARFLHRQVGGVSLCVIGYGGAVSLDAGQLGSFSILHHPIVGSYDVGGQRVTDRHAHLIAPGEPVVMEWSDDCLLLVIRFGAVSAAELGAQVPQRSHLGSDGRRLLLDLGHGAGASLGRTLSYVVEEVGRESALMQSETAARAAETLVLAALRSALGSVETPHRPSGRMPGPMERAEAHVLATLKDAFNIENVAAVAGIAPRTLRHGFRTRHHVGITEWARLRRLDRVYEELSCLDGENRSVTEVGTAWGFQHLGRFSATYAKRFGEQPRQTLRRSRLAQSASRASSE